MDPAARRDPITIQRLITGMQLNELGEYALTDDAHWQDAFQCFGQVVVKGTREFTKAGIVDADITHLIRVPLSDETLATDANMRIVLHATGEKCKVEDAYRRDASNREIEILCRN